MRQKLTITVLLLLMTKLAFSQTVLIDNNTGDTLVTITLPQMDKIYVELLQKDSLYEQAILSHSKELLLYEAIDSAKNDIKSLQSLVYTIDADNIALRLDNEYKGSQLKTSKTMSVVAIIALFLFAAL